MTTAVVPKIEGLNCPKCGAALEQRGFGQTLNIVCAHCLSILDASDPKLRIIQQSHVKYREEPLIPLGTRGKLDKVDYECIGFQLRGVKDEGITYFWHEYLLFNPFQGFRYLVQYSGHWNKVRSVNAIPQVQSSPPKQKIALDGRTYRHFSTASATTSFILGEFPWQVRVGETVVAADFISPPYLLSSETTEHETTWSLGEYITGAEVWAAFKLAGKPPAATGIYLNQPAPAGKDTGGMWTAAFALLLALIVMGLGMSTFSRHEEVYRQSYNFSKEAYVTPTFELKGHTSTVEIKTTTGRGLDVFINYALIDTASNKAWDFARHIEECHDTALVPSIPPGIYYLRVEPEFDSQPDNTYEIVVRRDVPSVAWLWLAGILILVPPCLKGLSGTSFETLRWAESDYAS